MVEMNPSVEYAPLEAALREASNGLLQKLKIDFPEASMKMGAWAKGLGMGESIESRLKWIARDRQDRVERDLRLLWTRRNRLARSGAC